jgi:hypothetical protein
MLVAAEAVTAAGASVAAAMRRYLRRLTKDTALAPNDLDLPNCYANSQPSTQRVWNNSQPSNVSKRLDYVEVLRFNCVPKDPTG